jgi:calpain-15
VLHRRVVTSEEQVMLLENQRLNAVDFTADFSASTGVRVAGTSSTTVDVRVEPKQLQSICTLLTTGSWELKPKFRFKLLPPASNVAGPYLEEVSRQQAALIEESKRLVERKDLASITATDLGRLGHFVDPVFPPVMKSVRLGAESFALDTLVHWRRPHEIFQGNRVDIFEREIEPNDIKQGSLGDCWFMCSLASLAERPELVRRLFLTKQVNSEGIYHVRFCKGGEWVTVTVDDYFPCFPQGTPIFSRSHGNELWVLLLEKAYAKLHGSYGLLRGGWASEGMIDLTGCPTESIDFAKDSGKQLLGDDGLWPLLKFEDENGSLISASTPGEDRWTEVGGPKKQGGLVPGHAYTVIQVKEAFSNRLLNLRNPWGWFEWDGDWGDNSPLWTTQMQQALEPVLDEKDGTFWMSYEDFVAQFSAVNICRANSFYEARVKGCFHTQGKWVTSKWHYTLKPLTSTKVFIGLHQEDERMYGVAESRPYLDIGFVVLETLPNGSYEVLLYKPSLTERQVEAEVVLKSGVTYIILPRTTGCSMQPQGPQRPQVPLFEGEELHPLYVSTFQDLYKKTNLLLDESLSYAELRALMASVGVDLSPSEFSRITGTYSSNSAGLTSVGFVQYMQDHAKRSHSTLHKWLDSWGYTRDLVSIRSRAFNLTFHSEKHLNVELRNTGDLDRKATLMLVEKYGEPKSRSTSLNLFCLYNRECNAFTYAVYNSASQSIPVTFDCSDNVGLVFSDGEAVQKAVVEGGAWELLSHFMISKYSDQCRFKPILRTS